MFLNGWIPYDAAIATSSKQVLVMTNAQFAVFDKTNGAQLALADFNSFFGDSAGTAFDPKCFYDPAMGRFVMMAVERQSNPNIALILMAVSQTSDGTGAWYQYVFDASLSGTTATGTWSDFPSLGYDDDRIYIGSNQYTFSGSFRSAKVRCWSKADLYSGGPASYVDFDNIKLADGSTSAFTVKPARNLESSSTGHFFATRPNGGSSISIWTVTGTFPSLTLSTAVSVPIGAYSPPPDAAQPGTTTLVATGDNRTQDVVWLGGHYYTAFAEKVGTQASATAAVRYLDVTDAGAAARDLTYEASGIFMYYPAVSVDPQGNVAMVFERSSSTEYVSMYETRIPAGGAVDSSLRVNPGLTSNASGRWGDYNAVANDPSDPSLIWIHGGYDNGNNHWATWIAGVRPSVGNGTVSVSSFTNDGRAFLGSAPNPIRAGSNLSFALPAAGPVQLGIFDAGGRRVRDLVHGSFGAGRHTLSWDGRGQDGAPLPSGVYWARLEAGATRLVARVAIVR